MPDSQIELGALNIVATPHPAGIYSQMLNAVTDRQVKLWGSDRGKITKPKPLEDNPNILVGQILLWAHIDPESPWLNTEKNVEATPDEKRAVVDALPGNLEPNFRPFYYAFVEDKHRLVFETRNEFGAHFSPQRAERMFSKLFGLLPKNFPASFDATVIPEADSVEKIFKIPRLFSLEILIKRPNADDLGDEYERILKEMEAEGADRYKVEKKKASKAETLTPTKGTKAVAESARENGYVIGKGKDANGKKIVESTEKHPKVRRFDVRASSLGIFLAGIRSFV
jgi:hypothetical protein